MRISLLPTLPVVFHLLADFVFVLTSIVYVKLYNKEVSINKDAGTPRKAKVISDGSARDGKVGVAAVLLLRVKSNQPVLSEQPAY
jgi:hypothetical protein